MIGPELLEVSNIGFVATRVCGTDGVSLEIGKWATILEHLGYDCFYVCGKSDRPTKCSFEIDEADYLHPDIQAINRQAFGTRRRSRQLSQQIRELARRLRTLFSTCLALPSFQRASRSLF